MKLRMFALSITTKGKMTLNIMTPKSHVKDVIRWGEENREKYIEIENTRLDKRKREITL